MKEVIHASPWIPAEWIEAHGLRARRIRPRLELEAGGPGAVAGLCPFARALAHEALAAGEDAIFVMTTACDQQRRVAELVEERPIFLFNMPATRGAAGRSLYGEELRRLGRLMTRGGGVAPDAARLRQALRSSDAARPGAVEAEPTGATGGVALALVAGDLAHEQSPLPELVAQAGGRIVLDAGDWGDRLRRAPLNEEALARDPFEAMADAYWAMPDVFQRPNDALHEWLARAVAASGARGLIHWSYPWCDLWRAEAAVMRERLGLPLLEVGGDDGAGSRAGLLTRLEAFVEMLR